MIYPPRPLKGEVDLRFEIADLRLAKNQTPGTVETK